MSQASNPAAKRSCYLSGPMRGRPDFHFPVFFAAEFLLRRAGWITFNPARMDVHGEGWPNQESLNGTPLIHRDGLPEDVQTIVEHEFTPADQRKYARRDCRVLIDGLKAERGDAIILLSNWGNSTGARAEAGVAEWVTLPRLTLEEALR